uniref:variable large family protein n=1 Tax=Borreliella garinii TaxID=29519 RepID=UPI0004940C2F
MKIISSAIFILTFFVFTNCKNNAGEATSKEDPVETFYQSIIKLGNGFLDVFTSFGSLVADAFGLKGNPKKTDVKNYFDNMVKKLEETKKGLESLSKTESDKESSNGDSKIGGAVDSIIKEVGDWLTEIAKAAGDTGKAANGEGSEDVGNVVNAAVGNGGSKADDASVKGIASGMKAIVEVAK